MLHSWTGYLFKNPIQIAKYAVVDNPMHSPTYNIMHIQKTPFVHTIIMQELG